MRKLALLIPGALVAFAGVSYFKIITSEIALFELFPEYNDKIIIKVHRQFVKDVLTGKYADVDLTDEKCNEIMKNRLIVATMFNK